MLLYPLRLNAGLLETLKEEKDIPARSEELDLKPIVWSDVRELDLRPYVN